MANEPSVVLSEAEMEMTIMMLLASGPATDDEMKEAVKRVTRYKRHGRIAELIFAGRLRIALENDDLRCSAYALNGTRLVPAPR